MSSKKARKFVRYRLVGVLDIRADQPEDFDVVQEAMDKLREMGTGEIESVEMIEKLDE